MSDIPETFIATFTRVTDAKVGEDGKKRAEDSPGGFRSFRGISPINITEKSVGKKIETEDGPMTISHVWRDGKAGESVTLSFEELPL